MFSKCNENFESSEKARSLEYLDQMYSDFFEIEDQVGLWAIKMARKTKALRKKKQARTTMWMPDFL